MNEHGDNKGVLTGIPGEALSIKHSAIADYASIKNPWISSRQIPGQLKYAVKILLEQKRNSWQFGKSVQSHLQTRTKQQENGFFFVRVSEYNQIRVALIVGCGPAVHLGDLKAAIIKEEAGYRVESATSRLLSPPAVFDIAIDA